MKTRQFRDSQIHGQVQMDPAWAQVKKVQEQEQASARQKAAEKMINRLKSKRTKHNG